MTRVGERPLVAVLVGTDHHPFDRLVSWSLRLAAEGWAEWFVQFGSTPWPSSPPDGVRGSRLLAGGELLDLVGDAGCVVCHAGPGLLMDAAGAGHRPVVVPRDPARGEHVDGHQMLFTRRMAATGKVAAAHDLSTLRARIQEALAQPARAIGPGGTGRTDAVCGRLAALVEDVVAARNPVQVR